MKLALTLLVVCCLYASVSHQLQAFMYQRRYPAFVPPFYHNYYYDSPQLPTRNHWMMSQAPFFVAKNNYVIQPYSPSPNSYFMEHQIPIMGPMQNEMDYEVDNADDYPSENFDWNGQIQGRSPLYQLGSKNKVIDSKHQQDGRLFFPGYSTKTYNNFNLLSLLRTSTSTTTVLSTVTSTLTSVTVKTCASAAQFISQTACRRRRYAKIFKELMNDRPDAVTVSPSRVQPMEASVGPLAAHLIREGRGLSASSTSVEIESSKQNDDENSEVNRQKRSFFDKYVVITSSSILTITSYSISASTITKSITLGIGNCNACVSCVPAGVTIC